MLYKRIGLYERIERRNLHQLNAGQNPI